MTPTQESVPAKKESFWRRRVVAPVLGQLTQGVTPDRIALTVGVGTACSVLPFLGFTTILNVAAGFWLRLNHPILQTLNQLLGPLQLLLIIGYVRVGEKIWQAEPVSLSVGILMKAFKDDPWSFLQRFGWTGVHAATAWLLSVPVIVAALYFGLRPMLRRVGARVGRARVVS